MKRRVLALTPFGTVSVVVAAGLAFLAVYPLARVLVRLFYSGGSLRLTAFSAAFDQPHLAQLLGNTLVVAGSSAVLSIVGGATLAILIERTDARVGAITDALPLVPFLLPPVAGAVGWVLLLSDRGGLLNAFLRDALAKVGVHLTTGPFDIYSFYGLIFVYTLYTIPYTYMLIATGLRNADSSLEEQARISGTGVWRTMVRVTLRSIGPSIGGAVLLAVWFCTALYSVPAIIGAGSGIDVLSVRIVTLLTFTYPPQIEAAVGLSMFVVITVGGTWYLQRRVTQTGHHVTVSGKAKRHVPIELGPWKWVARFVIFLYVFFALILPVLALLIVAMSGYWTPHVNWGHLNLNTFRSLLDNPIETASIKNSAKLAFMGASIGIAAAALVAMFIKTTRSKLSAKLVDGSIKLPAVFSSIVLAVGFIIAFSGDPFNLTSTLAILLMGYLALYLPQASVAADGAAAQVGTELPEASAVCGASRTRTFLRVSIPVMAPALAAGWALIFARMASDLTMSVVLSGPGNPVVGQQILQIFQSGSWADLAALSLVLTALTSVVVVVVLVAVRRRSSLSSVM